MPLEASRSVAASCILFKESLFIFQHFFNKIFDWMVGKSNVRTFACRVVVLFFVEKKTLNYETRIKRDKTMADKLMYIPNDNTL